jgi:putative phage-type endonuclease
MTAKMKTYGSEEEWRKARTSCIGGSDAACILGENPWKTNVDLWEEKLGYRKPDDISDNPLVEYGKKAEEHLRNLFALDHPELQVSYEANNMWTNGDYPYAHASLDGWLEDQDGRKGILEIKTATISGAAQKAKWKDGIPQNYYIQLLHYFMVTGFDFAILKAQLKYEIPDEELFLNTREYRVERAEVETEIAYLAEKEKEFADSIKKAKPPALLLPEI